MQYISETLKTPISSQCDVAVVGGGIAGVSAALSSARMGANVTLIERSYMLGGLATAGLISIYLPLCDGKGHQVSFGICDELFELSIKHGCAGRVPTAWLNDGDKSVRVSQRKKVQYDPQLFAILMEELVHSHNVNILYGTSVCGVDRTSDKINSLIIENIAGRTAINTGAVIDASGDATVCALAGEQTKTYSQGNLISAWYYSLMDGENRLHIVGESDDDIAAHDISKAALLEKSRYDALNPQQLTRAVISAHKTQRLAFLEEGDASPHHSLTTLPTLPQVRMTRKLLGSTSPTCEDCKQEQEDSIGLVSDWRVAGPVYEIPFAALCGRHNKNLYAAGRCISVSEDLWDVTRSIPACAVTGEAAGIAAAVGTMPHEVLRQRKIPLHRTQIVG